MAPLIAGWMHLPGKKYPVSGIIMSGFGIGTLLTGYYSQSFLNPTNDSRLWNERFDSS